MKKPGVSLAKVIDPTGRVDVAAYRVAERVMQYLERNHQVAGLCEYLLPVVEDALREALPGRNLIAEMPPELQAIFQVCMRNSGRLL